jgi:hypothetical protein
MEAKQVPGRLLYMVCYKTSPDSYQTYWNVYPADKPEDATRRAEDEGLFTDGRFHKWTVPYNKAGLTPEQTYAQYEEEQRYVADVERLQ